MLGTDNSSFFFKQKRQKRFQQRRVRKFDESGERRDGITFIIGEREGDAVSVGAPSLKSGIFNQKAEPASRKVSRVNHPSVKFPPIDPTGPNLVTAPQLPEEADTKSVVSERKLGFFEAVEAKIKQGKAAEAAEATQKVEAAETERKSTWSHSEAKFASTGILSKLGKLLAVLEVQESETEITLPTALVETLSQDHDKLVADTKVERREWQTDCYLDYVSKNTYPFLTGVPGQAEREDTRAALRAALQEQQRRQTEKLHEPKATVEGRSKVEKHVRMSNETKKEKGVGVPLERPHTARSVMSNFSFKSDLSDDERNSTFTTDYDRLPPELRPSIVNYRRESLMPKLKKQTRLEKRQSQVQEREEMMRKEMRKAKLAAGVPKRPPSASPKKSPQTTKSPGRPATAAKRMSKQISMAPGADINEEGLHALNPFAFVPKTTINFSVENPSEENQDWLVHPSDAADPESHTLRMWDKRLKELHRKREESQYMDRNRGADKPLVVKLYNEPNIRSLRTKHQRSATVPLPSFFNKLPPSLGSFSSHAVSDALMIGEGVKVFVLTLPDGSGYCNYNSGRLAISQTRCDKNGPLQGSKGLYTLVFDDVERSSLLAYFTPMGKACCYYRSGALHMLSDRKGGCLYTEDGVVTKKWEWPPPKMSMPTTISVYLNVHTSLRCTGLSNMDLRISSRGHSYKFPVGPLTEDLENSVFRGNEDLSRGNMQSACPFISKAAKTKMKYPLGMGETSDLEARRMSLKKRKVSKNLLAGMDSSDLQEDGDKFSAQLNSFKGNVQTIVNDWMKHYCSVVGITDPSLFSRPTSRANSRSRGVSSRRRMVKSSMDYTADFSRPPSRELRRTRSLTHPFGSRCSSRSITPLPEGGVKGECTEPSTSPLPLLRPETPLDHIQPPSPSTLHTKPFKVGKANPSTKSDSMAAIGCPIALHNMLWRDLDTMPPCKCDKRRVPYVCDLEYDVFLLSHVPRDQLIIICVTSSLKEGSTYSCEPMIDTIYTNQNRLRYSPCKQSTHDKFRLLKYDVESARLHMRDPEKDTALLVGRHNASPGMFLMYLGGKLVHADYMFNGYSNTKKDFMKHVHYCIQLGKKGKFMPYDFKFTRNTGNKILGSNTWAYPVSGFMQDLVLFSPQSHSQSTSRGPTPAPNEDRKMSVVITESDEMDREMESQLTLSCVNSELKFSQTTVLT